MTKIVPSPAQAAQRAHLDTVLERLAAKKSSWVATPIAERMALLRAVRANLARHADRWIAVTLEAKGEGAQSSAAGEEWSAGPWAVLTAIDVLLRTLGRIAPGTVIQGLAARTTRTGQAAVRVFPLTVVDRLLLSGVSAEIWMAPGVTIDGLPATVATAYAGRWASEPGRVSLVLGAGNVSSIAPLDALHKLYAEHSVALVKLNPVNAYLRPVLEDVFAPFVEAGFMAFVEGDADVGAYLTTHRAVDTLHITGSGASHDAIVFGPGEAGALRKARNAPINARPITSELGAVCPTIVVPGHWTDADLRFQAEHVATQKLHNGGFNCVASQVLVLPRAWPQADAFLAEVRRALAAAPARSASYPGTADRLRRFEHDNPGAVCVTPGAADPRWLVMLDAEALPSPPAFETEVFGPALAVVFLPGVSAPAYLEAAVAFANQRLHGTLGANLIIDPATEKRLGGRFETLIGALRYGTIGINAWTGLGFLLAHAPWGAFPGHRLNDIQSGRGSVHNALMFDRPQRAMVRAPFRPFPRGLRHGALAMLPKPPWFVANRTAATTARRLVRFQLKPSLGGLLAVLASALRG